MPAIQFAACKFIRMNSSMFCHSIFSSSGKNNRSVIGSSLYTCTDTTFTHHVESNEVDSIGFSAKINDIVVLPLAIHAMPVLACQDRLLRPIHVNKESIVIE